MMTDHDQKRERRIRDESIVDAYGSEEQALGWYYYLEACMIFHFKARCIYSHMTSPLKVGEVVKVLEMAGEDDCTNGMIVIIQFGNRTVGVRLEQLEPIIGDLSMIEAIKDWHYWVGQRIHILMLNDLAHRYGNINRFVFKYGWIEVGFDEYGQSFIRALDPGGLVWEGKQFYDSVDEAMTDLKQGLSAWIKEFMGSRSERQKHCRI